MKILHVITKADVGGAQTHVLELATGQFAAGHRVTLAFGLEGEMAQSAAQRGIDVVVEPALRHAPSPLADLRAVDVVRNLLTRTAPDVVHAHSSKAGLLTRLAARKLGVACVYTAHGWPFQRGAPIGQRVMSRAGETLAGHLWGHVICLTDAEAQLARNAHVVPADRLHVVPNGLPDVAVGDRADQRPPGDGDCAILMVARFTPPKDQLGVVRALSLLEASGWHMSFVGDGEQRRTVEAAAKQLGLDGVEFLGDRTDVEQLLARADVFVLWSRYEGMPLALMEAMRAGVACVANDLAGARDLIAGSAGLLVPHVETALAAALTDLIRHPTRRRVLGRAARSRFEQRFGLDAMLAGVDDVYGAAISDARASRSG